MLNLFAYTGGATLAAAAAGASVTHVDASKGMVTWARENAVSSGLKDAPIRWLVDDCTKFVEREIRRGNHYDGIIMDPPSYGRGPKGEIWKIEDSIHPFIRLAAKLLSPDPLFFPGKLLYHRSGSRSAHLHDLSGTEKIRRPCGVPGNRPPGFGDRTGSALRSFRALGQIALCPGICPLPVAIPPALFLRSQAVLPSR